MKLTSLICVPLVVLAMACAGSPTQAPPAAAPEPAAEQPAEPVPIEPVPEQPDPVESPPADDTTPDPADSACVVECVNANQMRAVPIEQIRADCRASCEQRQPN